MGKHGPPPTPTNLKLLRGETRPSRIGPGEPQPREALPEPPDWLDVDARDVWDRVLGELRPMGLAFAADADALVVYCNAVVNHARAQQALDRDGLVLAGARSELVRHPANLVANHNAAIISRFAREFGLTPAARVSLQAPPPEAEDSRALAARLLS